MGKVDYLKAAKLLLDGVKWGNPDTQKLGVAAMAQSLAVVSIAEALQSIAETLENVSGAAGAVKVYNPFKED
jgi:hypothetical protein